MTFGEGENRDYKYVLQDVSTVCVGARYTYDEIIEEQDIPFKIKTLVNRYIKPELGGEDLSVESHFYYMKGEGFAYQTFLQLKTRVKISVLTEKKRFRKKPELVYVTKMVPLEELVKMPAEEKEKYGVMIQEVCFSKLALMTL